MSAVRTSPGSSVSHQPPRHAPNAGPGGRDTQAIGIHDTDELPSRLADAIDDRIQRLTYDLGSTSLVTTQRCLPILRSRMNPSFS